MGNFLYNILPPYIPRTPDYYYLREHEKPYHLFEGGYGMLGSEYPYSKYPDGTHCAYKTAIAAKNTGLFAIYTWTLDVVQISRERTIKGALMKVPKHFIPATACGGLWGATVCASALIRKKDDEINYIFGGAGFGSVMYLMNFNARLGIWSAVAAAAFGVAYKNAASFGVNMVPLEQRPYIGDFDFYNNDKPIIKYTGDEF